MLRPLLLLVLVLFLALPAQAAELYARKTIAVFGERGDPAVAVVRGAFGSMERFDYASIPVKACDELYSFLDRYEARVAETAAETAARGLSPDEKFKEAVVDGADVDRIQRSAYALAPTFRFAPWVRAEAENKTIDRDGVRHFQTNVRFSSAFSFHLLVYDVAARKAIGRYADSETLSYTVTKEIAETDSRETRRYKEARFIADLLAIEEGGPRARLYEQAVRRLGGMASSAVVWARKLDPFMIKSQVITADLARDQVRMQFGKDLGIRTDHAYRVVRKQRQSDDTFKLAPIGYLKVRSVDATSSLAQPLIVDEAFGEGDQLLEMPRHDVYPGLKLGLAPLGSYVPALSVPIEFDFGPWSGVSELYGVFEGTFLGGLPTYGMQGEIGLLKKEFRRQWGWYYGAKVGALRAQANVTPIAGYDSGSIHAVTAGGSLVTGLNYHLSPDILVTAGLGYQLYAPTNQWRASYRSWDGSREADYTLPVSATSPTVSASGWILNMGFSCAF
ncbi:hypothetical protein J7643_10765 [bacterium]|nr:hypothetical protein [bacterium]